MKKCDITVAPSYAQFRNIFYIIPYLCLSAPGSVILKRLSSLFILVLSATNINSLCRLIVLSTCFSCLQYETVSVKLSGPTFQFMCVRGVIDNSSEFQNQSVERNAGDA